MISYFNPHYRFRGWAIIEDIISDWFTIFSIFILCKVKVVINILKRKWIESNQKFTYFFPSPKQQKLNQILLSLNVWSLEICSRRNETNFHPTIDKQNSAWNKQLTQERMTILKVNLQCQVRHSRLDKVFTAADSFKYMTEDLVLKLRCHWWLYWHWMIFQQLIEK